MTVFPIFFVYLIGINPSERFCCLEIQKKLFSVACTCVDYTIEVFLVLFLNNMGVPFSKAECINVIEQIAFVSFVCGQEVYRKLKTVAVSTQDFH